MTKTADSRIKAFWDARAVRRKLPGHCARCGEPKTDENGLKICEKCRAYNKKSHHDLRLRRHAIKADAAVLAEIRQFRRELNALRAMFKKSQNAHKKSFDRGRKSGQQSGFKHALAKMLAMVRGSQEKSDAQSYEEATREITSQELNEINHAYHSETAPT